MAIYDPGRRRARPVRQDLRAGQHLRRDDRRAARRAGRRPRRRARCASCWSPSPTGARSSSRPAAATPHKPVIVAKTGRVRGRGAGGVVAHRGARRRRPRSGGACSGRPGSSRSRSGQELLDAARALDGHPLPAGPRVAIITNSGGVGVELSDLLADEGLTVPALSAPAAGQIRAMLPPFASPANPVDVTPVWSRFAELYPALTDLLARSGEVDAVVPVLLQRAALDAKTADGPARRGGGPARRRRAGAGVRVLGGAAPSPPNADLLPGRGRAVLRLARPHRPGGRARPPLRRGPRQRATPARGRRPVGAGAVPAADRPGAASPRCWPSWASTTAPSTLCRTADEAVAAATAFPVVVKLAAAEHRTELGGVRLGLADAAAVAGRGDRAARRQRRGAGAAPAVRGGDRRRRVPRPGVRAGRDGRAGRDLGRGARRRRVRHGAAAPRRGPPLLASLRGRRAAHRRPAAARPSTSTRWPTSSSPPGTCCWPARTSSSSTSTPCSPPPTVPRRRGLEDRGWHRDCVGPSHSSVRSVAGGARWSRQRWGCRG